MQCTLNDGVGATGDRLYTHCVTPCRQEECRTRLRFSSLICRSRCQLPVVTGVQGTAACRLSSTSLHSLIISLKVTAQLQATPQQEVPAASLSLSCALRARGVGSQLQCPSMPETGFHESEQANQH